MQRSIWIVFLPLFLVLFAGVSWVSCCHLDIGNSVQSRFGSVLKSEMAAKNVTRGMRRLSKHRVAEDCEGEDRVERSNYVNSKRWRTMFGPHIAEGSTRCQNADAFEHSDNQFTVAEDLENSLQSNSLIALDPVIPSNTIQTKGKRYLQEDDTEDYDNQEMGCRIRSERWRQVFQPMIVAKDQVAQETLQMSIDQNFAAYVDRETDCQIRSRRSKRRKQDALLHSNQNSFSECSQIHDMRGQCSQSFGQALYQRSRQGLVFTYEDCGDNIYTCDFCNARFWSGEAIKRSSSNAPLIYTNCCQKGQIKIQQSKPAPTFLENLLNPDNGPESKLFRENIRVYNSMFCFTSMGATIDKKKKREPATLGLRRESGGGNPSV